MTHRAKSYDRPSNPATGRLVPNSPSTEDVRRYVVSHAAHGWMTRAASRLGRDPRWVHEQSESVHPLTVDVVAEASHEMTDENAAALADLCWAHRGLVVSKRPTPGDGSEVGAFLVALSEMGDVAKYGPQLREGLTSEARAQVRREAAEAVVALNDLLRTL